MNQTIQFNIEPIEYIIKHTHPIYIDKNLSNESIPCTNKIKELKERNQKVPIIDRNAWSRRSSICSFEGD